MRQSTSGSIRQDTPAIRQDTSEIRQDTSEYVTEILACLANEVADLLVAHAKLSAAVEDLPQF
jgi:hypothetical protein